MNLKNTLDLNTFRNLSQLISQGFSLEDALSLLETFDSNKMIIKIKYYLKDGYSFIDSLRFFKINSLFLDTFQCLFPFKGLSQALSESLHFVEEMERWKILIKKQWLYPSALMSIMALFSFFVKGFLLPEMNRLYMSFGQGDISNFYFDFISYVPNALLVFICFLFLIFLITSFVIFTQNMVIVEYLLKLPLINYFIQTYYSLKFAYYLSKTTNFFESFYETMTYLNQFFKDKDLCFVIEKILNLLKDGYSLNSIIQQYPYFTKEFKHYFSFIIQSKQSFELLENYCHLTFGVLEKKFITYSKVVLFMIYIITGIYVLSLYSLMILPILEITNAL